jgi:outer membrane protein with beta-barrel domain
MFRTLYLLFFSMVLISLSALDAEAQYRSKKRKTDNRFNAGLIMGLSLSQIDGDRYTGFDKIGIRGGLKGSMYLNDRLDMVVGLLYNQKGARFEKISNNVNNRPKNRVIHFDYMEAPILINFKMEKEKENGFFLETGFSYARLINHRVEEVLLNPTTDISFAAIAQDFNSNEFNFIVGVNCFFNDHIGAGFHYTVQMNKAYHNELLDDSTTGTIFTSDPDPEISFLRNFQVAFQLVYNIF